MSTTTDHTGVSTLEIDPSFAQSLGLELKSIVDIKVHTASDSSSVPIAHTIHLEPLSSSDWEIIELHAQYLESRMLNQVRAVSLKQPIVVFPSPTAIAHLSVTKIEPPIPASSDYHFAKLSLDSEVVIAPKTRKKQQSSSKNNSNGEKRSGSVSSSRRRAETTGLSVLLRAIPIPHSIDVFPVEANTATDYQVFVTDNALVDFNDAKYAYVSIIRPPFVQGKSSNSSTGSSNDLNSVSTSTGQDSYNILEELPADDDTGEIVRVSKKIVAKITKCPPGLGLEGYAGLSHALSISLGVSESIGHVVRIEPALNPLEIKHPSVVVRPFVIQSSSSKKQTSSSPLKFGNKLDALANSGKLAEHLEKEKEKKLELIKKFLFESSGVFDGPITGNMRLPPIPDILPYGGILQLKSAEGWMIPTTKNKGKSLKVELGTNLICPESVVGRPLDLILKHLKPSLSSYPPNTRKVVGIDKNLNEINESVRSGFSTGILVYGSRGSGKTAVLRDIAQGLYKDCIHHIFITCGTKAEDPIGSLKDLLTQTFLTASWYAPSVVVFDDIDKLIPAEVEHADSTRSRQLSEIFQQLASSIMAQQPICIVASAQSTEAIHSHLITSHVFENTVHLKSPDREVRRAILDEAVRFLALKKDDTFDMLEIAGSTEGYQPGDLWTLAERSKLQTVIRQVNGLNVGTNVTIPSNTITQADFENALTGFVPASLRGVKLQKSSVSWSEIGGLRETKRILLETLEWPTRYAPIFAKSPLRLRSGLLLYGYPGCGKTLLASAVASQSGLNFISVKGPEILNKYIGASEQSVRDLFERAQAAKPCILFFDEFDSIAPKRGHDSTGVTDRVVNQMLTQMDGAEGLDGVYVLAATSRPDLIDSALLRPGRLDKSMLCDMPDLDDRIDILNAVKTAGNMVLSDQVSLQDIAEQTEGFSGADLQAVLYNAYLEAIHDIVDISDESSVNNNEGKDSVDFFHIENTSSSANNAVTSGTSASRDRIAEKQRVSKKVEAFAENGSSKASQPHENSSVEEANTNVQAVIKPQHVKKSLEDTQPSISHQEMRKYRRIYEQFVSGRSGDMPNGENSTEIGGRATLM